MIAVVEAAGTVLMFLIIGLYVALGHWVGTRARRKGKSYLVFFATAVFASPLVGLILVEMARDNHPVTGDLVETVQRTDLDDGTVIPRKFRAEVLATKVLDQVAVVQIRGPDRTVWLARDGVQKF